jgi:hypothetical protein
VKYTVVVPKITNNEELCEVYLVCVSKRCVALRDWLIKAQRR